MQNPQGYMTLMFQALLIATGLWAPLCIDDGYMNPQLPVQHKYHRFVRAPCSVVASELTAPDRYSL